METWEILLSVDDQEMRKMGDVNGVKTVIFNPREKTIIFICQKVTDVFAEVRT